MTTHAAFLRSICENPADDSLRLIYADWLEEQGQGQVQRAEFIRAQIVLSKPEPKRHRTSQCAFAHPDPDNCERCRYGFAMIAEEKLLDKHFHEWTPTFFDEESGYLMDSEPTVRIRENERYSDDIALTFRRGFVSSISLPCAAFMSHAKALFESQPIEEVRLVDREPDTTGNLWFCWARGNNMAERGDIPAPLFAFLPRHARLGDQSVVRKTRDESISDLSTACVAFGRQQAGLGQISPKRVEEDRVPRGVIYANPPDTPREVLTAQQEELAQAMRRAKRRKK